MTTTQSFKIFELLNRYFKNDSDTRAIVQEIETIIENKFEKEKNQLSTKEDIYRLEQKILEMQAGFERRFNNVIMWIIGAGIGFTGIIITFFKLLVGK